VRSFFAAILLLLLSLNVRAEPKDKEVSFKDVSSKVSDAFCKKMDQCSKEKIPTKQCVSEMKEAFLKNYDVLPADKRPAIADQELKQCTKTIQDTNCDDLKSAQSLPGCEFIQKLNPSS